MALQQYTYKMGMPRQIIEGTTTRSISNIDSLQVREAVLTPQRSTPRLALVIGTIQRDITTVAPEDIEKKIEQYSQDVMRAFTGSNDPYPANLIALIYHQGRKTAEDIKNDLFTDPLNRVIYKGHQNVSSFIKKENSVREPWEGYSLIISGVRKTPDISGAQEYLDILNRNQSFHGLTRIESLKRIVLDRGNKPQLDDNYTKAHHEFLVLLSYLKMIHELEQHTLNNNSPINL